jgi:hypothetical protein
MEIRNQSKTGPVVPPPADIAATLSDQIDDMKQRLLDRLNRDPAGFAQIEVEIHDRSRRLADPMTAGLLAEATTPTSGERAGPEKKGGPGGSDRSRRPPQTRRPRLRLLGGLVVRIATIYCGPRARTEKGRGREGSGLIPSWPPWASARAPLPPRKAGWAA